MYGIIDKLLETFKDESRAYFHEAREVEILIMYIEKH